MPIDPASLSGKTLWLRAKDLTGADGSSVTAWTDQSGATGHSPTSVSGTIVKTGITPAGGRVARLSGASIPLPILLGHAATASSTYSSSYVAGKAVDGSNSTSWIAGTDATVSVPQWLRLQPALPTVVTSYEITPRQSYDSHAPSNWTFEGSNDGSSWTTLDTRTGEAFTGSLRSFSFSNSTAYTYYRINVTATPSGIGPDIAELGLNGTPNGQSPGELWIVIKSNSDTQNAWKFGGSAQECHYTYSGQVYTDFGNGTRRNYTPSLSLSSQFRLIRSRIDSSGNVGEWIDETSQMTATGVTPSWTASPKLSGSWTGDIAEVLLLTIPSDSTTKADLITYFNTEHGLTVPGGSTGSVSGTVSATASAPTVAIAGTVAVPVTGTVAASPSSPTVTVVGDAPNVGTVSATASAPSVAIAGTVAGVTSGTVQATASAPIVSIAGDVPTPITGTVSATPSSPTVKVTDTPPDALSGSFALGSALTSDAITVAGQTLPGGFAFGSTQASLNVEVEQAEGGFSFGSRLKQQRDWGIDPRSTRPTPAVVIAHRDGTPVTNLPEVNIGELTSAVGALDSWQFTVDRDNAEGKKVDPVALEAHLYRGTVLMSKGPIGPGRLNDGRMIYDVSDPRWYLWDGRHIDRRPRLNWVYNGDFSLGTAGWTGGYEPGSIPEAIPEFSVVDEPESTSGKGLRIGGVDKVVTSVANVETAAVFVPNSSAYLSGGAAVLIAAANGIPNGSNINIVGHTADRRAYGDPGNGLALSLARAQAARSTLHAHNATWSFSLLPGLRSPNMNDGVVAGRGYYEQVASNSTEASSAKNRRVALHYASTQTAAGHKQYVYQRKTGIVNPVSSKVELPVVISGRMRIGEWLGAPANGFALWAQVYNSSGVAVGATSGSVEPATATMSEQTPRERWIDYDVTVNIPPDGQTYWIEYRLFPPAGWAVWSDIEVTPDEQLGFFDVDQALIIRDLVAFAQDPAFGHGPLGIGSRTPLTGVTRTKEYKFREHRPIGTAVEELTSMAHGPEVDCEVTPNSATVVTHYPRQGTVASFSLAHGGPRSIVKAYQPLPANTRTLASSVVVQAWGISNNRYERFIKDDAALGGALLETVIDADAATPVNELAEVARQSLARSIHPLAAWEVTLDPSRTSEVLDEIGKGDVVLLSLPDEDVHALHRVVSIIWDPETDVLTLQLAPEEA